MLHSLTSLLTPIHPAGWLYITLAAVAALILSSFLDILGSIGLIVTLFLAFFFRDPARISPQREGLILAPADGKITFNSKAAPPEVLQMGEEELTRISISLNLMDAHVIRIPAAGSITIALHQPGNGGMATHKDDSANERHYTKITLSDGTEIGIVQIAGALVRRIVNDTSEGQTVIAGEKCGIIKFGSRVDLYLPKSVTPLIIEGQRSIAGETVLADLKSHEPVREGISG